MAPIITDPKKLSMPQQVQKNKDDIAEIKKVIDGLDSLDNVVIVPDISHIMTAKELESVRQPVCFIVYNNHLYIKKKEESGNAYFDIVFSIVATTVISFQSSEIEVNLSNGALGITNSTVSTYSNSKVDELLSLKASITYVDSNFASLAGANFTGAITAPSIIEDMSGYSFTPSVKENLIIEGVYAGAVKNGNKLTYVYFGKITRTGDVQYDLSNIGVFRVPKAVGNKIIPTTLDGSQDVVRSALLDFFSSPTVCVSLKTMTRKYPAVDADGFTTSVYGLSALTLNKEYQFRYEATFLLSNNLLS